MKIKKANDSIKRQKTPISPIINNGIRKISPNNARNNYNGIEAHKKKKQLTGFVYDKSRNAPLLIVKYTEQNRYTMLMII